MYVCELKVRSLKKTGFHARFFMLLMDAYIAIVEMMEICLVVIYVNMIDSVLIPSFKKNRA